MKPITLPFCGLGPVTICISKTHLRKATCPGQPGSPSAPRPGTQPCALQHPHPAAPRILRHPAPGPTSPETRDGAARPSPRSIVRHGGDGDTAGPFAPASCCTKSLEQKPPAPKRAPLAGAAAGAAVPPPHGVQPRCGGAGAVPGDPRPLTRNMRGSACPGTATRPRSKPATRRYSLMRNKAERLEITCLPRNNSPGPKLSTCATPEDGAEPRESGRSAAAPPSTARRGAGPGHGWER